MECTANMTNVVVPVITKVLKFSNSEQSTCELVLNFRAMERMGSDQDAYNDYNYYSVPMYWKKINGRTFDTSRCSEGSITEEMLTELKNWIWQNKCNMVPGWEFSYYAMCGKFLVLSTRYYIGD